MGGIEVWDINTRQRLARGRASPSARNVGHAAGQLVFSPDGRLLADAWLEMAGRIWDLTTDPPAAKELSERSSTHRIQAFSPDASILLVGDLGGAVRIFDTESAQCRSSFIPHVGRVFNIAFTDDGKAFWTSGDGDLRLWEITPDAGIRIVNLKGDYLQAVDASPDGRWLASGGVQGTLYRVDRRTGEVTHTSIQPRSTVSSIAFSPDSSQLAVATYANVVHVFPTERPGEPVLRLDHPFRVSFVSFSPDGTRIATACDDFVVRLWRTSDGRLEREFRQCTDRIPQVVFDPTGQQVAAVIRNGSLLNWDLSTDSCTTLVQPTQIPLRAVRYSRDGRWLAAAGADRTVNIWSLAGLRRVASLAGHNQEIYCLDLSPDGTLIATGDSGGTIRLWHITLQKPLATLNGHSGAVMALRFTADGSAIVSSGVDGTIREWDLIHYHRHVAGQVDTQLRKLASPPTASDAAAWRDWASRSDLP
jgi:WD40 repeat protein